MSPTLRITEPRAAADLEAFLGRAARVEESAVRIIAKESVASFWVPILRPQSIVDVCPLVIGVRALRADVSGASDQDLHAGGFDVTVPIRGLLDRLARLREEQSDAVDLSIPPDRLRESWAGITPPSPGWELATTIPSATLIAVADQGIAAVAEAVPGNLGTALVDRVRTQTWTRVVDEPTGLTSGAAFAALSLGFLRTGEDARILRSGPWLRLETRHGNVLMRSSLFG